MGTAQLPRTMPQQPQGGGWQGVYGQMGIPQQYLQALNSRFGWSPQGIAYGQPMQQQGAFYQPPQMMPQVPQLSALAQQPAAGAAGMNPYAGISGTQALLQKAVELNPDWRLG